MVIHLPKRIIRDRTMAQLFEDGKTLEEIGNTFGLSRERVRQVLKERGISSEQGGAALRRRREIESIRYCQATDCKRKVKGHSHYCHWHKERTDKYGSFDCLVEGCKGSSVKYGMCNKHGTNFFLNRQKGYVKDLNDYLKVQLAKKLMNCHTVHFTRIRNFMKENPEHFEKDLYTGDRL